MKAVLIGNRINTGSTILEGMIALAILTLSMSAAILISFTNQTLQVDSATTNAALAQAHYVLSDAQARSQNDFNSIVTTPELVITDLTPCRKRATSYIAWATEPARPQRVALTTELADLAEAYALGSDCIAAPPASVWNVLSIHASYTLPARATALDALNGIVYASIDQAPYVAIADTTRLAPFANGFNLSASINALDVAAWQDPLTGQRKLYAYAAMNTLTDQLKVIDVTDAANPVLVATRSLTACVGNSFPQGWRLYYYRDRLYFVTRETAGPEFHVFDVSSPANPIELGQRSCKGTELNTTVNSLIIRNRLMYLATTNNTGELKVYDVTDSANTGSIVEITAARQDLPGNQNGQSLFLIGNTLYLGRQSASGPDLYVYNVGGLPNGLVQLGSADIGTGVIALRVAGSLAFIGTPRNNQEFQIWNISNPADITHVRTLPIDNLIEHGLDYEHDVAYTASAGTPALQFIASP